MTGKKMLITGGAGFIGVNAARHFAGQGWQVSILDNFSRRGTEDNLRVRTFARRRRSIALSVRSGPTCSCTSPARSR